MSNTAKALIAKFLIILIATWATVGFMDRNPFIWVAIVAILVTVLDYTLGDLMILPKVGNIIASLGDGVMAALIAYIIALFSNNFNVTFTTLAVFGLIVAVSEFFFHRYLVQDDKVEP